MKRTRIKICGIQDVDAASAAVESGADAIGLVFVEKSARCVSTAAAMRIVRRIPAFIEPVGVFANHSVDEVRRIASAVGLRTVQLHGDETPEMVAKLNPLRVIRAFAFNPITLPSQLQPWEPLVNDLAAILMDAPPPQNTAPVPGNTSNPGEPSVTGGFGTTFDWDSLAALLDMPRFQKLPPLILAGGLTPENVADAIRALSPYAVDVSSGVEFPDRKGVKDLARIRAFCDAVHNLEPAQHAPGELPFLA